MNYGKLYKRVGLNPRHQGTAIISYVLDKLHEEGREMPTADDIREAAVALGIKPSSGERAVRYALDKSVERISYNQHERVYGELTELQTGRPTALVAIFLLGEYARDSCLDIIETISPKCNYIH